MESRAIKFAFETPTLAESFSDLSGCEYSSEPYPHAVFEQIFSQDFYHTLSRFLKDSSTEWNLVHVPQFYEDYELVFDREVLPDNLVSMLGETHLSEMKRLIEKTFNAVLLDKVSIEAHKLIPGQEIRLHTDNDYSESHRLIIHLNDTWEDKYGGFFVVFNSANPQDINRVVRPLNGNAVAFEIGPKSYHAVSKVHDHIRFSLVYTFYKA